jgi:hypothetical protein
VRDRRFRHPTPFLPRSFHAVARLAKLPIHWLLEGFFIVVSVALGFGVAQYGEYRANRELTARVLTSLQAEIEYNLATLEPYIDIHRKWAEALAKERAATGSGSGIDLFMATRPELPAGLTTSVPILRRAAWDATLSTGALLDYDLVAVPIRDLPNAGLRRGHLRKDTVPGTIFFRGDQPVGVRRDPAVGDGRNRVGRADGPRSVPSSSARDSRGRKGRLKPARARGAILPPCTSTGDTLCS